MAKQDQAKVVQIWSQKRNDNRKDGGEAAEEVEEQRVAQRRRRCRGHREKMVFLRSGLFVSVQGEAEV